MERILTVSQLNDYIFGVCAHDPILRRVTLRGEVSNYRVTASGHAYFALHDDSALIRCVCFASQLQALRFSLVDGMQVKAKGYVSVYVRDGQMQLYVEEMQEDGFGELYLQYEELKKTLDAKGYFSSERKRPIPSFPRRIGVVTSSTGAVIHDIANVSSRRNPTIPLLLCPSSVQGVGASEQIARAIELLNQVDDIDIIIVARGGGSIEDLWAFNEIMVADAIYHSAKPVVSAVGHETDFSIADLVADMRAPTPSAAAELCTPRLEEWKEYLDDTYRQMKSMIQMQIEQLRSNLQQYNKTLLFAHPKHRVDQARQQLDGIWERFCYIANSQSKQRRYELEKCKIKLESNSPFSVLERGYTLTQNAAGETIGTKNRVQPGDRLLLRFFDGTIQVYVESLDNNK